MSGAGQPSRGRAIEGSDGVGQIGEVDYLHMLLERRAREQAALYEALRDRDARLEAIERSTTWKIARRLARLARPLARASEQPAPAPRSTDDYRDWIARFDAAPDAARVQAYMARLAHPPVCSIVTVLDDPSSPELEETVASLRAQYYERWRLVVVDPRGVGVPDDRLDAACRIDPRIRRVPRSPALGREIDGDYLGWVDPGDTLRPHSLAWMVAQLASEPTAVACYSDEDVIAANGERTQPWFKPAFDPLLLLQTPYTDHLLLVARDRFDDDLDPAEHDHRWEAMLRLAASAQQGAVVHVPAVLYHRRTRPDPTRDTAVAARALARQGLVGHLVHPPGRSSWALSLRVPSPPEVTIVVPTRDRPELLAACLETLERTAYPRYEVVVIDNGSVEADTRALLADVARRPRHRVLSYPEPFHFGAMHNWAIAQLTSPLVCLVNNDVELREPSWLQEMVGLTSGGKVGAVGALLLYPDGLVQHCGVVLGIRGETGHRYRGVDPAAATAPASLWYASRLAAVTGAVMLLDRDAFTEIGGFDEDFAVSFGDIDLCLSLRTADYEVRYTPLACLVHGESRSRGHDVTPEAKARHGHEVIRFWEKWAAELEDDPAWNPNLSLADESGALAWPPRVVPPWEPRARSRPVPCPDPARYFPLMPLTLAPGATLAVDLGDTTGATALVLWLMEGEPEATATHRLSIGDATTAFTCSWLHTEPIALALPATRPPAAPLLLRHEGTTALVVEAVLDTDTPLVRAALHYELQ